MLLLLLKGMIIFLVLVAVVLQILFARKSSLKITRPIITRGIFVFTILLISIITILTEWVDLVSNNFQYAGCILIIMGLILRLWSQITLGQENWSADVKAPKKLVTSGPYRFLRHPMYDAFVFIGLGIILFTMNLIVALGWIFFWILLFQRALNECIIMDCHFKDFRQWSASNKMLFPPVYLIFTKIGH